jgi:hypothetical protein
MAGHRPAQRLLTVEKGANRKIGSLKEVGRMLRHGNIARHGLELHV